VLVDVSKAAGVIWVLGVLEEVLRIQCFNVSGLVVCV